LAIDVLAALIAVALQIAAQRADSARCDSVVAAARVDSVPAALFLSAHRIDGPELEPAQIKAIVGGIGSAFSPPRPFRLTVFAGPSRSRSLRVLNSDTTPVLRAPTVTGIYRFTAGDVGMANVVVARASRVPGFDSAAVDAIHSASLGDVAFVTPVGLDIMRVDVQFTTDSTLGSRRLVGAYFPRMPVVDAAPLSDNVAPSYPDSLRADSLSGEVVVRFVVDRDGTPDLGTLELIRSTDVAFTREALAALARHRFRPASIRGCAVAQQIDYAMTFSP